MPYPWHILFDFHSIPITISFLQEEKLEAQEISNELKVTSSKWQEINVPDSFKELSRLSPVEFLLFPLIPTYTTHKVLLLRSPVTSTLLNPSVSSSFGIICFNYMCMLKALTFISPAQTCLLNSILKHLLDLSTQVSNTAGL